MSQAGSIIDLNERTDDLFAAAERSDWSAFRAFFADDAVFAQNVRPALSIDDAMVPLEALMADGKTVRYENVRRVVAERAVTEMHDAVFTMPTGETVRLDICVVIEFSDDGLIIRADEYLDSRAAAAIR